MTRRLRAFTAMGGGFAFCFMAIAAEAQFRSSSCIQQGEIVTFDGVASAGPVSPDARHGAWMLNLPRPICVLRRVPFGPGIWREMVSSIRIIGTPPPIGVPLALTGKLVSRRDTPDPTLFAALEVIRGRRMNDSLPVSVPSRAAPAHASHAVSSMVASRPLPRATQAAEVQCDAPPYGGTAAGYQDFVQRFGRIVKPAKILTGICNAKFGRGPRDGLHKLGLSDAKIESESTEKLAADTIVALKSLVNTIE